MTAYGCSCRERVRRGTRVIVNHSYLFYPQFYSTHSCNGFLASPNLNLDVAAIPIFGMVTDVLRSHIICKLRRVFPHLSSSPHSTVYHPNRTQATSS